MNTFDRAIEFVLSWEGDVSDDPHDTGGLTRWGISQAAYPKLDIRNLTREDAVEIYRKDYWNRCQCNQLPAQLAIALFDGAVNQGPVAAIRLFQRSLGVRADGVMGPETIAAGHRARLREVLSDYIARRGYQYALHPQVPRFGLGWFRRLAACHQLTMEPF